MLSNKTKRNIWLAISVVTFASVISHAINVAVGAAEWWQLFSVTIVFAIVFKCYRTYRKAVKAGNLFGKVKPF